MDFEYTDKMKGLIARVDAFMKEHILPAEAEYEEFVHDPANLWVVPPILEELKAKAKAEGLWNLFLPKDYGEYSPGLTNLEYAPLAELMGQNEWASEVFNCSAPDTGNMEVLARYGSEAQKKEWLVPLLNGEIRSSYLMTEPQNACSDATNVECSIVREGDEYVINGRKTWSSAVYDPRCKVLLVMGKTDFDAPRHIQQSTIIVPKDTPGVKILRPLKVMGELHSPQGHGEVLLENVRVPVDNIILGEGRGFEIAQGRLGPGRIHHCMRLVGAAQRCLELMCVRVENRSPFGKKLSEQGSIRQDIAKSRCEIEQARMLTLLAANKLDNFGNKVALDLIAMIKIVAPQMCQDVADRAMQAFGGMGVSQDTPIAQIWAYGRFVRLADGPDEVHMSQLGKLTIRKYNES
ncbi:acyl-CoA dehydrogenase family protein [Paraglaciecola sp. 20A4]|uniref:acyl-CoA dehydrogenase family protein n=1 Tax=Paraglaciecola sp. 20A4 TaxID=2687288 RepID=UPI00140A1D1C|nr:acyl-CoA dehydrogenase family protein [Paraglaciecola sp. 20A4]